MLVNVNGKLRPSGTATVSVKDHGLLYGYGLYISLRSYGGHLFLIDDHLSKLQDGLQTLGIEPPGSHQWLEKQMKRRLKANGIRSGIVRLTVTGGNGGWKFSEKATKPNLIVFTSKKKLEANRTATLTVLKTAFHSLHTRYKALSRLNYLLAAKEMWGKQADEGLFLDGDRNVAEGIASNVFIVRNGIIRTPPLRKGVHPGITRQFVISLAKKLGHRVEEKPFSLQMMQGANEIFLTSATKEIVPVTHIDGVARPAVRPITDSLQREYRLYTGTLRSVNELKAKTP